MYISLCQLVICYYYGNGYYGNYGNLLTNLKIRI